MIFGLDCEDPIPDGYVLLEAFAVIKVLDEDGDPSLLVRHTPACDAVMAVGMLTLALEEQKNQMQFHWSDEDEDDDD